MHKTKLFFYFLFIFFLLISDNTILYNTAYTRKKRADNNYTDYRAKIQR